MLLVVNYHYLRDPEDSIFPGIHGVSSKRFELQIENLCRNFEMITPSDIALRELSDFKSGNFCLITFDDGLKEQFEKGKPLLDKHNVSGVFFINGVNVKTKIVSFVHKIHWLRSLTEPKEFINQVYAILEVARIYIPVRFEDFEPISGQNIYDSAEDRYIKYLLNHLLNREQQELVIDELYRQTGSDEFRHSESLYFTEDIIRELSSNEMLGSHGYRHDVKTQLSKSELENDILMNQELIAQITGKRPALVSYPYGGQKAVSVETGNRHKALGFKRGFTMERAINTGNENEMLICRLDANDIPFGKTPLVEFSSTGITVKAPCTQGTTWFQE